LSPAAEGRTGTLPPPENNQASTPPTALSGHTPQGDGRRGGCALAPEGEGVALRLRLMPEGRRAHLDVRTHIAAALGGVAIYGDPNKARAAGADAWDDGATVTVSFSGPQWAIEDLLWRLMPGRSA